MTLSIVFFGLASVILDESLIFYLGIAFSGSILFFFYYILLPDRYEIIVELSRLRLPTYFLIFTAASALLIVFVQPYEGSVLNWTQIPLQNWLRLAAALLMTSFFPGYFLLKIIDKNGTIIGLASVVVSNLLSILVVFSVHFITIMLGYDASFSSLMTLGVSLLLAALCNLILRTRNRYEAFHVKIAFGKNETALLIATLLTVSIGALYVMFFCMPLTRSDMWIIHSQALDLSKGFPIDRSTYPYLFQMYLSVLFKLSGLHSALTMQMLYAFSFLPVLAFYIMIKKWFMNEDNNLRAKIPVIGTYLSVLLGFGGLYMLYLRLSDPQLGFSNLADIMVAKTYDSYMRFPFAPYMVILRWSVGLTVLFTLLYLVRMSTSQALLRNVLLVALTFLGYAGHTTEAVFFLALFILWEILFQKRPDWKAGFSILLGLLVVGLADFLAPVKVYTVAWNSLTGQETLSIPYVVSIMATLSIVVIDFIRIKKNSVNNGRIIDFPNVAASISGFLSRKWAYLRWCLIYSYFLCTMVWLFMVKDYNLWTYGGYSFVPFFLFPIRFGVVGLLAVVSIAAFFPEIIRNRKLAFFMLIFVAGILFEQVSNYFPVFYMDLDRFAAITNIGASVIGAYGLLRMTGFTWGDTGNRFRKAANWNRSVTKKSILSSFTLLLLIVPSALGTSVYYAHMAYLNDHRQVISDSELKALQYIENNLCRNESVLTLTDYSAFKLRTFAGVPVQSLYTASNKNIVTYGLLTTADPYVITYILGASNTKYVYMTNDDTQLLDFQYSYFESFLEYLSIVFVGTNVTVYEIPTLMPASNSSNSEFGIVHFLHSDCSLSFDGSAGYVEVQDSPLLRPRGEMTLEIMVKKIGSIFYKFPIDKPKAAWVSYSFIGTSDQKLRFMVGIDSGASTRNVTTSTVLRDNEWYNLVGTYDGVRIAIYVDGKLENESFYEESKGIYYSIGMPLGLGRHISEPASYFKGAIDDVRIYDRALSPDEILYDYEYKTVKNTTGLSLKLDLDWSLQDASGNHGMVANYGATFQAVHTYSEKDAPVALLASMLGEKYSLITADQILAEDLSSYISDYAAIVLDSDPKKAPLSLLDWVSRGRTLMVLNAEDSGYFSNLTGLDGSTDGVFRAEQFGSGRILFCNIDDLLRSHALVDPMSQAKLIDKIRSELNLTSQNASPSAPRLPGDNFNMTYGNIDVKGNLSLSSDLLFAEGSVSLSIGYDNYQAEEVRLYGTNTLNLRNVSITISSDEPYLVVRSETIVFAGKIESQGGRVVLVTNDSATTLVLNDSSKAMEFNASELSIKTRLPMLNASGNIHFESLYTHIAPYIQFAGTTFEQVEVNGNISFRSLSVSGPIVFHSNFVAVGQILGSSNGKKQLEIPWSDALGSHYSLALNIVFFSTLVIYLLWKRRLTMQ